MDTKQDTAPPTDDAAIADASPKATSPAADAAPDHPSPEGQTTEHVEDFHVTGAELAHAEVAIHDPHNKTEGGLHAELTEGEDVVMPEGAPDSLDKLVKVVLDSAAVANRTAEMAAESTERMLGIEDRLEDTISRSRVTSQIVLATTGAMLVIGLGLLGAFGYSVTSSVGAADDLLESVSKRVNDLNLRIDQAKRITDRVAELDPAPITKNLQRIEKRLDAMQDEMKKPITLAAAGPVIDTAAEKRAADLAATQKELQAQIKSLDKQLQAQTDAQAKLATKLSEEIAATNKELAATNKELAALNKAQAEKLAAISRSLEALTAAREKPPAPKPVEKPPAKAAIKPPAASAPTTTAPPPAPAKPAATAPSPAPAVSAAKPSAPEIPRNEFLQYPPPQSTRP